MEQEVYTEDPQQEEQQPAPKLSVPEFASKIKTKYPQYKDVPDDELVAKIINKYPQYKDSVELVGGDKKKVEPPVQSYGLGKAEIASIVPKEEPKVSEGFKPTNDEFARRKAHRDVVAQNLINGKIPSLKEFQDKIPKYAQVNQPVSTDTNLPEEVAMQNDSMEDKTAKNEIAAQTKDEAIENTAKKILAQKGIINDYSKPLGVLQYAQLNEEKNKLKEAVENGDAVVTRKKGEAGLNRTIGWWEGLSKGWNEATRSSDEADEFVNNMDAQEKLNFLAKQQEENKHPEYLGEKGNGVGSMGEFVGSNAPFLGKAVAGTILGTAATALAPETGGISTAALPTAMAFLFTAPDMVNQAAMGEIMRRYETLKRMNPDKDELALMQEAEQGKWAGGGAGLATNALLMGTGIKMPVSATGKAVIGKAITKALESSVHMGATTAAVEGVKQLEGNLEGIKSTPEDIAKSMATTFEENATVGLLLHTMTQAVNGAIKLPKVLKSAIKYGLKDANPAELGEVLKMNEAQGVVPEGTAEKVVGEVEAYKKALSKTADDLPPEVQASVAGLIEAKDKIIAEREAKDETQRAVYDEKIAAINEQINKTIETGKPYEHEVNELSGETYGEEGKSEPQKGEPENISQPIELSTEVTSKEEVKSSTTVSSGAGSVGVGGDVKELNSLGADIAFDKPQRKDYGDGEKGDLEYANANIEHNKKVDEIIGGLTQEGTLRDNQGGEYLVTITSQGVRVVNKMPDGTEGSDISYRKGKRITANTPFTNGFSFKPKEQSIPTQEVKMEQPTVSEKNKTIQNEPIKEVKSSTTVKNKDGEVWNNRGTKINEKGEFVGKDGNTYTVSHTIDSRGKVIVKVKDGNGKTVSSAYFEDNGDGTYSAARGSRVESQIEGVGLAKAIYDYTDSNVGKIRKTETTTDGGDNLWSKNKSSTTVSSGAGSVGVGGDVKELNSLGADIAFDKPQRKDYGDGEKGDLEYANANIEHNKKVDEIIGGLTQEGTLRDNQGGEYLVTITSQGVRVVNKMPDGTEGSDISYRKGKRITANTPFTNGFSFKPKEQSIPTQEVKMEQPTVSEKNKTIQNEPIKEPASSTTVSSGVKSNWNYEGEGDALSGKDGQLAYTQRLLPDWNRESQKGNINPDSKITYDIVRGRFGGEDNKEVIEAKDENGVTIGVIKKSNNGGIEHLVVAPEFRNKGVATELYNRLKNENPSVDISKTKQRTKNFADWANKLKSENKPIQNEPIKEGAESTQPITAETKVNAEASPVESGKSAEAGESGGGKKPPVEENAAPEEKGRFKEKGILNRIFNSENVPEHSKKGFEEKGLKYEPQTHEEAERIGKTMVDEYGIDDAVTLAETAKFKGGVNSAIFAEVLNRLYKQEQDAKTPQAKLEAAKQFAEVGIRYDEFGRGQGRDISQIAHFYKKSPLGVKLMEEARRREDFAKFSKNKEQTWREFFDEMTKEPEFDKIVKEKISEELKKERAEARKKRIDKIDKFFDDAINKLNDGGAAYSSIIPITPKVLQSALKGMKEAYHAGESIAKIIEDAVDYISEKMGSKEWDVEKFKKDWEAKLGSEEKYKKAVEEISEEKRQKLLDRFRKKLKGLTEKEKDDVIRKSFKKLVENGALEYEDFKKIIAETLGYGEMTPEQAKKITDLVTEINAVDDLATKLRENERNEESLKKYQDAKKKAEKSATELGKMVFNRPDIVKRLLSIMQLNTLGIPSLINNPIFNVFNQATVRLPRSIIMTAIDYAIYGGGKLFGKDYKPENNIIQAQREFYKKLGYGSRQSVEQLFTGLTNKDYFQKEVYASQIHPTTSVKELWSFAKGETKLTKAQVIDKTIQATAGVPAEVVARVLNIGDKPQRFAAEGAQAATFAHNLGLQGIDYKLFMEFPKEEAYRKLKKDGFSDEAAMKKAEEIQERIIKEGEESTFQQDNLLNDAITAAFKPFGKAGDILKTLNMPFVKIPLNAFWSVYNLANPEVAMLQSMIYGVKALKSKSPIDIQQSKKWFAHAVTGMAWMSIVGGMAKSGIINSPNADDTTKKEREGEQFYEQQNSVNISKLLAYMNGEDPSKVKNGLNVDLKWLGNMGILMGYQAQKLEAMTPEQRENGIDYMEDMMSNLKLTALDFMDKGVFSNTNAMFTAINKGGSFLDNYLINLMNMGANIVQPAAYAQISRAQLPYYSKVKADSFLEQLDNNFSVRSSLYRNLTGKYPPSKIGIWGDTLDKKDNTFMRLFGISRANDDNFAQPIYEDYKKSHNTKFFPSAIKPEIKQDGATVKLNTNQVQQLETLVGQQRKALVAPYINDMATFEGSKKRYSDLKTDEEKTDKLQLLYDLGYQAGVKQFFAIYPELKPKEKTTKEQNEEDEKAMQKEDLKDANKEKLKLE